MKYEEIKVNLHKRSGAILTRDSAGRWYLDGNPTSREEAIKELVEAVQDLGYWCQVAKDVLPEEMFDAVQESYAYEG